MLGFQRQTIEMDVKSFVESLTSEVNRVTFMDRSNNPVYVEEATELVDGTVEISMSDNTKFKMKIEKV